MRYLWWPIRLMWATEPFQRSLWGQIKYAIESYSWTMNHPHHYRCAEALHTHQRAARRPWHGWYERTEQGVQLYGWTIHLGRLKILFGK